MEQYTSNMGGTTMGEAIAPVCVKCGKEMQCIKNGTVVWHPMEPLQQGGDLLSDIDFIIIGDMYRCEMCGCQIVKGFPNHEVTQLDLEPEELRRIVEQAERKVMILRCGPTPEYHQYRAQVSFTVEVEVKATTETAEKVSLEAARTLIGGSEPLDPKFIEVEQIEGT